MSKRNEYSKKGHFREYRTWQAMKDRCLNPNNVGFLNYGGRGIKVHPAWIKSFDQFYRDMGKCPAGKTIDRKDNDGNYEPGNCRWANRKTQANNNSRNRLLTFDGRTQTAKQWQDELGILHCTLSDRSRRGARTISDAVNPPDSMNGNLRLLTLKQVKGHDPLREHVNKTLPIAKWAELLGMKPVTLVARLRSGLDLREALTRPVSWSRRPKANRTA